MNRQTVRLGLVMVAAVGAGLPLILMVAGMAAAQAPAPASQDAVPPSGLPPAESAPAALPAAPAAPLANPIWRVGVTADGLYRLSYETMDGAGVPVVGTAPSAFHLTWRGQPVALYEEGTGDGTFDPGDALLFYGEKFRGPEMDEKYTDENVYWLAVDGATPGLRMGSRDVTPGSGTPITWYTATVRAEENLIHWSRWSTDPGTPATWFWEQVIVDGDPITRSYPITLSYPLAEPYTATLHVELASLNYENTISPDHHIRLNVNGITVGDARWDGMTGVELDRPISATTLFSGVNQIQVVVMNDVAPSQNIYVDRLAITFRRALAAQEDRLIWPVPLTGSSATTVTGLSSADVQLYDVTHSLTPTRLINAATALSGTAYALSLSDSAPAGTTYLAATGSGVLTPASLTAYTPPTDLLTPTTGADEIIVVPPQFITAVQPLANQRRAQGLRVRVVNVEDLYVAFNGGIFHPSAIRDFVIHAHDTWPGAPPAYLLLFGDGNFNFKGYNPTLYGEFVPSLIPPYLAFADPDQGEVPVDSWFGDVDGDGMPEAAVGRIPASTLAEAEAAVLKILTYENFPSAAWASRVLMVADDGKTYDEGFSGLLDALADFYLPPALEKRTVYISDYCGISGPCPAATVALTQTWSQGAALLTYAGHGAIERWAHEPLLVNTQMETLTGTTGLPFLLALDCWDGSWMYPPEYHAKPGKSVRSMGEWATTVLTDRGAVAAFGPAGLGYISTEAVLAEVMYQALFEEGVLQLGPLTQAGREAIPTSYLARTYTLLGDPALHLRWWAGLTLDPAELTVTVGTSTSLTSLVAATGTASFGGDFVVDPSWTVGAGSVDGWGRLIAPTRPTVTHLTAYLGPISATVTLHIVAGEPATVTVSPDPLIVPLNGTGQVTAAAVDLYGNPTPLTVGAWSADVGTIDVQGVFTAPGFVTHGWITATSGSLSGRAAVQVRQQVYLPLVIRDD